MRKKACFFSVFFLFFRSLSFSATYYSIGVNTNWNVASSWSTVGCGGAAAVSTPGAGDDVIICTGTEINVNVNSDCLNLIIEGAGILDFATNAITLSVGGNLTMDNTGSITGAADTRILNVTGTFTVLTTATGAAISGIQINITGATTINGTFSLTSNTGVKTFAGAVTVNAGGSWASTAITTEGNLVFKGGITGDGTLFSAGGATFNTNNQTLAGTTAMSFSNNVTIAAITLTNSSTITISTVLNGTTAGSTWTNGAGSTLNYGSGTQRPMLTGTFNVSVCANTVNYNNAGNQDITAGTYCNLTCSGSGTKTSLAGLTVTGNFTLAAGVTMDPGSNNFNANGNSYIYGTLNDGNISGTVFLGDAAGDVVELSGGTIDCAVTEVVNINGTISISPAGTVTIGQANLRVYTNVIIPTGCTMSFNANSNTGWKEFQGSVTINGTGVWNSNNITTASKLIFQNGITSNGTSFSAGAATFNTNAQSIEGSTALSFGDTVNVGTAITVTNNTTVNMTSTGAGALTGNTWTQGANSTLNYAGSTITVTAMNASANPNTVNYSQAGAQTIFQTSGGAYHNLTLSGSGTKTASVGTKDINGNLSIQGTAVLDVNTNAVDITLAEDWSNSSTNADPFVEGTRTVTFDGSALQTITNTGDAQGTEYNNLTINKSANDVTLNAAVAVNGTLTLTARYVILGTNNITIGNSGSITGYSSSSFVASNSTGLLQQNNIGSGGRTGSIVFPVGHTNTSTAYAPVTVDNTTGTVDRFDVKVCDYLNTGGTCSGATEVTTDIADRTWTVNEGTAGGSSASITLQWNVADEMAGFDRSNCHISHHDGSQWGELQANGAAAGSNPYTRTVTGVTSFSPFAVGSASALLPIQLLSFTAKLKNNEVELAWVTASEINNDYFTIERTTDGINFTEISQQKGAGNSREILHYTRYDKSPLPGISYYRLKQTDFDGKYSYSNTKAVEFNSIKKFNLKVFPNPCNGENIKFSFTGKTGEEVLVVVYDAYAREIYSKTFVIQTNGKIIYSIDESIKLSPGIYLITAIANQKIFTKKLIVN